MDIILKKDTELFHASGEEFEPSELRGGGYDHILWTTQDSAISQAYIPVAGSKIYVSTEQFLRPSHVEPISNFQKEIGLEFENVNWIGNRAEGWGFKSTPFKEIRNKFDNKQITREKLRELEMEQINIILQNKYGYEPDNDWDENKSWKLKLENNKIVPDSFRMQGKLFVLTLKADIKIYDLTFGGAVEGDLTDLDYHKIPFFQKLMKQGYDGVKINDFAQSNDFGNFGHTSIGLFPAALPKINIEVIPNVVHHDMDSHYRTGDYRSQEYKKHRNITEHFLRKFIRNTLCNEFEMPKAPA